MFTLPNFSKDIPFQQHTVLRLGIPRQLLLLNVRAAAWKLRTRVPVLLRAGKTRGQRRAIVPSPSLPRSPQELPRPGRAPSSPPPLHPRRRREAPTSPPTAKTCRCPPAAGGPRLAPTRTRTRSPPRPRAGAGRAPAHLSPRPAAGRGAGPAEQVGAGGRWRWRGLPLREGRRGGGGVVRL